MCDYRSYISSGEYIVFNENCISEYSNKKTVLTNKKIIICCDTDILIFPLDKIIELGIGEDALIVYMLDSISVQFRYADNVASVVDRLGCEIAKLI